MGIEDNFWYICKFCGASNRKKEEIQKHEYHVHLKTPELREKWKPQPCFIPMTMQALYLSNDTTTTTTSSSSLNSSVCSSPSPPPLEHPPPIITSSPLSEIQENIEPIQDDKSVKIEIENQSPFDNLPEITQENIEPPPQDMNTKFDTEIENETFDNPPELIQEINELLTEQTLEPETKPDDELDDENMTTTTMPTMKMKRKMRSRRTLKKKIESDTNMEIDSTLQIESKLENNQNLSQDQPVRRSRRSRIPKIKKDIEDNQTNTNTSKTAPPRLYKPRQPRNKSVKNNNRNNNNSNNKILIKKEVVADEEQEEEYESDCPKLDPEDFVVKCDLCQKRFKSVQYLNNVHIHTHTGERPFKCSKCSYCTSQSSALIVHMRVHSGEQPFACRFCDKKFSQSGSRLIHERSHTKETPYICPKKHCRKGFPIRAALLQHQKSHRH